MLRRPRTLRGRLTLMFALVAVALSALVGLLVDYQFRAELRDSINEGLRTRYAALKQQVEAAGNPSVTPPIPDAESFAQVVDSEGSTVAAAPRALLFESVLSPADLARARKQQIQLVEHITPKGQDARLWAGPATLRGQPVAIIVGSSLGDALRAQHRLELALAVGLPLLAAITTLTAWFVAGAALAPVRELIVEADTISALTARSQKRRLSIPRGGEELAELARRLNDLLARIEAALEHERAFLDDASHELRTPIAIARGELELALMRADDPESREAMESSLEEIERLDHLATNLLVLARTRSAGPPPDDAVDLVATAEHAVTEASRVGTTGTVDVSVRGEGVAAGDAVALERAIANVVDNACRHATHQVVVTVERHDSEVVVEIRDDGPGFSPGVLDAAFGRFVQGDHDRGGAGLGLAIVDAIVAAHGGSAEAHNAPEGGAVVVIELPAYRGDHSAKDPAERREGSRRHSGA